jgi:hypothetical protein
MIRVRLFLCILFTLLSTWSIAQTSFWRNDSIPVTIGIDNLRNAWAGGLNFCQFSEIDLDMDGINDLFVFDRQGNSGGRVTTYLNKGVPNSVSYVNAPQYASKFPLLQNWAILADYNCDGKPDIFTCANGGIKVYENTSTLAGGLSFRLVSTQIMSVYGISGPSSLYVSANSIPAIVDVDGDGDLDILTYSISGQHLQYHKNHSIELYGTCDSLNCFIKDQYCFGGYEEGVGTTCSNYITQGMDSCKATSPPPPGPDTLAGSGGRHAGGNCILCFNEEGNKNQDIMLGHAGCTGMTEMKNTGSTSFAKYTTVDYNFPAYDLSVNMNAFVCGSLVDVDNDGKKDLLFSPNNQQAGAAEDFNSVDWYKNIGTNDSTVLNFRQHNFLQDQMMDVGEGAFPVLHDYDGDGLADLFIGNYGYFGATRMNPMIALFHNTGTVTHPKFDLVTRDFAAISLQVDSLYLSQFAPAFGDLDGDGDADLVIGDNLGHLYYFEKLPGAADNYSYVPNFLSGIYVGEGACPQLIDLNRDGKLDLVVGNRTGSIFYYQNNGSTTVPVFSSTPTSTQLGGVNTQKPGFTSGFAAPFFYDEAGSYKLLVGTENGEIKKYGNIDGNLTGTFTLLDPLVAYIGEGQRSVPYGYDINGDGLMDMFVGNFSGGLEFYQGSSALGLAEKPAAVNFDFSLFPNPAGSDFVLNIKEFSPGSKYLVRFSDMLGRTLLELTPTSSQTIVSSRTLPSGTYACEVSSGDSSVHHKLLIRK